MNFWIESSDDDYKTMKTLYNAKDYAWSLFVGHLVIEKLIKALYAKTNAEKPYAPKLHNLITLIEYCNVELDQDRASKIGTINTFNISSRYDTYKREFKEKATEEYTTDQINKIEEMIIWLKQLLT
jgi:HEPN domain-containing protein